MFDIGVIAKQKKPLNPCPIGQSEFIVPGTYTWTAPIGVDRVCVVCIGGGGSGSTVYPGNSSGKGGGGGGLGWKNNISVVPGQSYTVVVGVGGAAQNSSYSSGFAGGASYFISQATVAGLGGDAGGGLSPGGSYVGDGGGTGGTGANSPGSGGGGAGGYSGNGGDSGAAGSGGGAGGGGTAGASSSGGGGGGTGLYGQGTNGAAGYKASSGYGTGGGSGSGGGTGTIAASGGYSGAGGRFGGGAGGGVLKSKIAGSGAVRIIWGADRAFPATNAGDL